MGPRRQRFVASARFDRALRSFASMSARSRSLAILVMGLLLRAGIKTPGAGEPRAQKSVTRLSAIAQTGAAEKRKKNPSLLSLGRRDFACEMDLHRLRGENYSPRMTRRRRASNRRSSLSPWKVQRSRRRSSARESGRGARASEHVGRCGAPLVIFGKHTHSSSLGRIRE
jgi:hypothetical protein